VEIRVEIFLRQHGIAGKAHSVRLSRALRPRAKAKSRGTQGRIHQYTDEIPDAAEDGEHEPQARSFQNHIGNNIPNWF
jgi:hypothetical protein